MAQKIARGRDFGNNTQYTRRGCHFTIANDVNRSDV